MIEKQIPTRKKAISINIKRVRLERNYTQEYLGQRLSISQNAYSKIEMGRTSVTIEKLLGIADILEVNIMELIGGDHLASNADNYMILNSKLSG